MSKIYIKMTCGHFIMKNPVDLDYEYPGLNTWVPCPTCGKKRRIQELASMRKEAVRDIVDASEITKLKSEQPHLTDQECLYVVRRRPNSPRNVGNIE